MEEQPQFHRGHKVLCYHGPLLYEAKILKTGALESFPEGRGYLVHYNGWKTKWDEWVAEDRVVRLDAEGLARARELRAQHAKLALKDRKRRLSTDSSAMLSDTSPERGASPNRAARADSPPLSRTRPSAATHKPKSKSKPKQGGKTDKTPKTSSAPPKRAKRDAKDQETDALASQPEAPKRSTSISIGNKLKYMLATEWDSITKRQYLYTLPAPVSVKTAVGLFLRSHSREQPIADFCDGLVDFFDKYVGRGLLYRFERLQFWHMSSQIKCRPSEYYGVEHLARLLLKLPVIVCDFNLGNGEARGDAMRQFSTCANQLVVFLSSNFKELFRTELQPAPPDYVSSSKNL